MGNITGLNVIAEELKTRSDSCMPLSKLIVQLAEDFDFDGILKLAEELERYLKINIILCPAKSAKQPKLGL
jgi:hypothetical protein